MDKKGVKENDEFQVRKEEEPNNQLTSDDFKTGDYVVGMYYAGSFGKKLNLLSEFIYNRYNIHEDRLFSDTEWQSFNPYKGNKDSWRYNLSANYSLTDNWSLMADYTMTWKDYRNRNRQTDGQLYQSSENRSKVMGAVSYQPNQNLNVLLGTMHYSQIEINFVNILKLTYMHKQTKDEMIDFYLQEDDKTYQTLANCNFRHNYVGAEGDYELTKSLRLSFVANYQWYHRYIKEDDKHFGRTWYLDTEMQWKVPRTDLNLKTRYYI